jgi:hypothetical protein
MVLKRFYHESLFFTHWVVLKRVKHNKIDESECIRSVF